MKHGLMSAVALAALVPMGSLAAEGDVLGVTSEDIARGSLPAAVGRNTSAEAIAMGADGRIEMTGFRLQGDRATLSADQVVVLPTGQLTFENGKVEGFDTRKSEASYERAVFSSQDLVERLILGESCSSLAISDHAYAALGDAVFDEVNLVAPALEGDAPIPGLDQVGPEKLHMEHLALSISGAAGEQCFLITDFLAERADLKAADGSTGQAKAVSGSVELTPSKGTPYSAEMQVAELTGADATGGELMRVDWLSLEARIDPEIIEGMSGFLEPAGEGGFADGMRLLSEHNFGMRFQMEGINFPLGALLSDSQREHLGVAGSEVIAGDFDISLTSEADHVDLVKDIDLKGLVAERLQVNLKLVDPGEGAQPMGMLAGHPAAMILPYLELEGLEFDIKDDGLWALIERGTGASVSAHMQRVVPFLRKAPPELSDPITAWVEAVAASGQGGASMTPAAPVGFTDLVMATLMSPASLGEMLNIEAW